MQHQKEKDAWDHHRLIDARVHWDVRYACGGD